MISRFVGKLSRARHIRVFFRVSETFTFRPQWDIWRFQKCFVPLQRNAWLRSSLRARPDPEKVTALKGYELSRERQHRLFKRAFLQFPLSTCSLN